MNHLESLEIDLNYSVLEKIALDMIFFLKKNLINSS